MKKAKLSKNPTNRWGKKKLGKKRRAFTGKLKILTKPRKSRKVQPYAIRPKGNHQQRRKNPEKLSRKGSKEAHFGTKKSGMG